jgi:pimeloyl-ACP methyl ester carboxylesterase
MMNRRDFVTASAAIGGMIVTNKVSAHRGDAKYFDLPGSPRIQVRRRRHKGRPSVLYIHGTTFPSALSVGYRFADGKAWEDSLHEAGFDVWALDFQGFGGSERPLEFDLPADCGSVPLQSGDAVAQIARAIAFIHERTSLAKVSLIAHSWGGVCAARFASEQPENLDKLVLFAPPLMRPGSKAGGAPASGVEESVPAWELVTVVQQLTRFVRDTPPEHSSVLAEPTLAHWGSRWLATDPKSGSRSPPAVQVPGGFGIDLDNLWNGVDVYDPSKIKAATLLVRGEWDSVCTDADAALFRSRMTTAQFTDAVIPKSGHLAHLETNRALLWAATNKFLTMEDRT